MGFLNFQTRYYIQQAEFSGFRFDTVALAKVASKPLSQARTQYSRACLSRLPFAVCRFTTYELNN
jgi:hypothetical protein